MYRVEYENGVVQYKLLVDQEVYDYWYNKYMCATSNKEKEKVLKKIEQLFGKKGSYFTSKSPLAKAINSGVMYLPNLKPITCKITLVI